MHTWSVLVLLFLISAEGRRKSKDDRRFEAKAGMGDARVAWETKDVDGDDGKTTEESEELVR